MNIPLTTKQQRVYAELQKRIDSRGQSPTLDELRKALSPGSLRSKVRAAHDSLSAFSEDALAIMQRLKRGQVQVDIQHTDIRHLGQDINTSSNRLAYALVISALLVFSALVVRIEPYISGISVYTVIGLIAALIALIMLLLSISREGKKGVDPHP